jgi:6-phosphogluconolactonase
LGEAGTVIRHEGRGPNPARQDGPHAHSVFVGPDDRFAYAPDLGIDKVMIYRIVREGGKLEAAGFAAVPPGSGPRHMKFGKDGRHAYVLNELTLTVAVFARDAASGRLEARGVVPVLPDGESIAGMTCSEIRVSADGRFVYTANRDTAQRGRDSVSVLEVAADGGLKRVQTVAAGVAVPRNIALAPGGNWLLVCGQESNEVAVLGVDPASGKVGAVARRAKLEAPMCVTFARP